LKHTREMDSTEGGAEAFSAAGAGDVPNKRAPMTVTDLRAARESRANEALKMKDEQMRILSQQNSQLLSNLDKVEEDANNIQLEKLAVEEENRTLRDSNFELQSKARAADAQLKKSQAENADKDKQLKIMTDQNAELLRLLETEEAQTAKLASENDSFRKELEALRGKYGALLTTAKTHEEMATRAAREGQLRAEEVRLLRAEVEQLKNNNAELKMKTQVELEALQEQLRVRKEKQYQLLEKLQGQEEAKRQAEDQVTGMEDKLRQLHSKNVEIDTQLQVESRGRRNQEDANKQLTVELSNTIANNKELQAKIEKSEQERLRMEAEARDSGEQLREMAEKVFQLLERLKLAELGKTKAMEALQKKEQEMIALKKKNSRLIKESTKEGKARVKAELDKKVLQDQIRALKKHNSQLSQRCREEVKLKIKEHEEREQAEEKVKTLGGRLSFLLNKMQADEEAKVVRNEEMKKMEAQIRTLSERGEELQRKLDETGESNRIITQAMRVKQDEIEELQIKIESLQRMQKEQEEIQQFSEEGPEVDGDGDVDAVRAAGGRGRFYTELKPSLGIMLLKGKKNHHRAWLEKHDANGFLKRAQKTTRFKELAIERIGQVYALLMVEEEDRERVESELRQREEHIEHLSRKTAYLQDRLGSEEDAKRRTLLRYVNAVKAAAGGAGTKATGLHGTGTSMGADDTGVVSAGGGVVQLPESGLTDEEVHAVAALLRSNTSIVELNLRGNLITDEGARALSGVLGSRSGLQSIDLRGNRIGKQGIRSIAEALERAERVRHVYVHAGGKVEALGTGKWAAPRDGAGETTQDSIAPMVTVETVCVVDMRENSPTDGDGPVGSGAVAHVEGLHLPPANKGTSMLALPGPGGPQASSSPSQLKKLKAKKKFGTRSKEEIIKAEERERLKALQQRKEHEDRKNQALEAGWDGRAGGLEIRLPPANGVQGDGNRGLAKNRGARSAPALNSAPTPGFRESGTRLGSKSGAMSSKPRRKKQADM